MRPKNNGIHDGLEDLIPTGFAFPKPPTDKRPDSSSRPGTGRPTTAVRGLGASGSQDLLGSISKLEKESEQRAMELIKLRTLILKLEAQREDALDTVKQIKKENADTKEELARAQSEVTILRKEQVANRISGWLDTATGLSTVRAASYLPDSPMYNERAKSQLMAQPGHSPSPLSKGVGGSSMGGYRKGRVSGPGYASIDVTRKSPNSVLASPPPPSPLTVDVTAAASESHPDNNLDVGASSAQILQLQSELEQALIVQQQALADKADAEAKFAEALSEKESLEKERKERQEKERKVVDSNRLLKEKEEALRRLQEVVAKLEEDKDHEVQMRQVEIQHLRDLHDQELKKMKDENEALRAEFEALKSQATPPPPSPSSSKANEQLMAMEAAWEERLAAARSEARVKIEELDRRVNEAEEALVTARSDSERYQKEVQILREAAEAMAREASEREAQHQVEVEVERSSLKAQEDALSATTGRNQEIEKSLASTKDELFSLRKRCEDLEGIANSQKLSLEASEKSVSALKAERDAWKAREKDMMEQLSSLKPMILQAVAEAETKGRKEADAAMKKAQSKWDEDKKAAVSEVSTSSSSEITKLKSEAEELTSKMKEAASKSALLQKAADEASSHLRGVAEELVELKRKLQSCELEKKGLETLVSNLKADILKSTAERDEALKRLTEAEETVKKISVDLEESRKVLDSHSQLLKDQEVSLTELRSSEASSSEKLSAAQREMEAKMNESKAIEDSLKMALEEKLLEKESHRLEAIAAQALVREAEEKASMAATSTSSTLAYMDQLNTEIEEYKKKLAFAESSSQEASNQLKASEEKSETLRAELSTILAQKAAAEHRALDAESLATQFKQQLEAVTLALSSSSPTPYSSAASGKEGDGSEKDDINAMRDQSERMRVLIKTMALQMETLQNNLMTQTSLVSKVQAALEEERQESEALNRNLESSRRQEAELKEKLADSERRLTSLRIKFHDSSNAAPLVATRPSSAGLGGDRQSILSSSRGNQSQRGPGGGIVKQGPGVGRSSTSGHSDVSKSVELPALKKG